MGLNFSVNFSTNFSFHSDFFQSVHHPHRKMWPNNFFHQRKFPKHDMCHSVISLTFVFSLTLFLKVIQTFPDRGISKTYLLMDFVAKHPASVEAFFSVIFPKENTTCLVWWQLCPKDINLTWWPLPNATNDYQTSHKSYLWPPIGPRQSHGPVVSE